MNQKRQKIACNFAVFFIFLSTSASATDWVWQLENETIFESIITIKQVNGSMSRYQLQCDLTDALNENVEKTSSSTISVVKPKSHPSGLLIATCHKGAHSEVLYIIDPSKREIAYKRIGSFFVGWYLTDEKLIIDYDMPCQESNGQACTNNLNDFITISESWPPSNE